MENKTGLRPCPFCGGDEIYVFPVAASRGRAAMCQKCLAEGPYERAKEKAAEAWNRRAEPENRVLTLAELEAHYEGRIDAAPLWIEHEHNPKLSCWMVADMPAECFNTISVTQFLRVAKWSYGKRWRCWLRKPTAEEMANTPWEKEA